MLDEAVNQIIERRIIEEEKERKDSGWQPVPLYDELELPREAPQKKEKTPSGQVKIDIWGPQNDDTIVDNNIVTVLDGYSPKKYL